MEKNKHYGGLNLVDALLLIFIVLKLTGVISWSWLWVLSPLWVSIGIAIVIVIVLLKHDSIDR